MTKYVKKLCWTSVIADALMLAGGDAISTAYMMHSQPVDYAGMIIAFAGLITMFQFVRKAEKESYTDKYIHWELNRKKVSPFFLCGLCLALSVFGVIVMLCGIVVF